MLKAGVAERGYYIKIAFSSFTSCRLVFSSVKSCYSESQIYSILFGHRNYRASCALFSHLVIDNLEQLTPFLLLAVVVEEINRPCLCG